MASPTLTSQGSFGPMIPNYWDRVLGDNLRPNLYLYDFGEKRTLPKNFGKTIKIPRWKKSAITASVTEGTVIGTCPISAQFISGTLSQFGAAFKHTDLVVMTALSDVIQGSLEQISYDIAKKMDTYIRDQISATGAFVGGNGTTNSISIGTADTVVPKDFVRAKLQLALADNPHFPGSNCYGAIIHPRQTFAFQTFLSTNAIAWADVSKYSENAVEKIFAGEIGRWFNIKFVESTNAKVSTQTLSIANTSYSTAMVFAPRAFYITELNGDSAKTYVKQLGSSGTADPINQICTVGAKVYFLALPATWSSTETRMVRVKAAVQALTAGPASSLN